MEIARGVHRVSLEMGAGAEGPPTHVYYVRGRERGAFIDAGFPDEERTQPLLDYWRGALDSPSTGWALITHRHYEHAGGARLLREATGARVAAGRADAAAIDADFGQGAPLVDQALDGEEAFDLGDRRLRAIATPGHTAGTVCYLLEGEGLLFTGDHIMGEGSVVVRTDEGGRMADHIASLRKLLDLDVRTILSGHGPPIHDPHARIRELIRHRLEREEEVLRLLGEGVGEVDALLSRIYRDIRPGLATLARHQVVAHLQKLVEEGRAVQRGDRHHPA